MDNNDLIFLEDFNDIKDIIGHSPEQSEIYDAKIASYIHSILLAKMDTVSRAYHNRHELGEICRKVAALVGFRFTFTIMTYRELEMVMNLQPKTNIVVGVVSAKTTFALIDMSSKLVAFHVPKGTRLRVIEQKVDGALGEHEMYMFKRHGIHLHPNLKEKLREYLCLSQFPKLVPPIEVRATRFELKGGQILDYLVKPGIWRRFQVQFEMPDDENERIVLYYHVL